MDFNPSKDELVALAKQTAVDHGLDPLLVCAVIEQESFPSWNIWSIRAEPAFDARYVQPLHLVPTEDWARSISWGLMQVMGEVAREHGYKGDIPNLLDPTVGIPWGCVHLKIKLAISGGDVRKALLLWNGGGDPLYPDKVLARVKNYA